MKALMILFGIGLACGVILGIWQFIMDPTGGTRISLSDVVLYVSLGTLSNALLMLGLVAGVGALVLSGARAAINRAVEKATHASN